METDMTERRTSKTPDRKAATTRPAEVTREYGPFPGIESIHGVTHDGARIWAATGTKIIAIDPQSGDIVRSLETEADAGTAFDGKHLYQLAEDRIDKIDPETGKIVKTIPAPGKGR